MAYNVLIKMALLISPCVPTGTILFTLVQFLYFREKFSDCLEALPPACITQPWVNIMPLPSVDSYLLN